MVVAVPREPRTASKRAEASPFHVRPERGPLVRSVEVDIEVRILDAAESRHRAPMTGAELPPRLHLQVSERREVLVRQRAGDEIVVGAARAEEPRAGVPKRRRAFHDDVAVGHTHRGRPLELGAPGTVVDDQQ